MTIQHYCSWLFTNIRILSLLTFTLLSSLLHAGALTSTLIPLKTPAEVSVTFELADTNRDSPLCSGARFSYAEIATSQSCLEKLKSHISVDSPIHAISSHGEDYGEILLPVTNIEEEETAVTEVPQLVIVMLTQGATPTEAKVLWPAIYTSETPSNSAVTIHRKGQEEDNRHKRSVTSQSMLGTCEDDVCSVYNNGKTGYLNDGEPVFYEDQLLCVNSRENHCLSARSLAKRQSSQTVCNGRFSRGKECINLGCPVAPENLDLDADPTECCIIDGPSSRSIICNYCPECPQNPNRGCFLDNNAGSSSCTCAMLGEVDPLTPQENIIRSLDNCSLTDKNFPETKTARFIAGISVAAIIFIGIPCLYCTSCACLFGGGFLCSYLAECMSRSKSKS